MSKNLDTPFEFKFDEKENTFEGFASVYGNVDGGRDVVVRGAFEEEIRAFDQGRKQIPILWQHNPHNPIGLTREMRDTRKGLYIKAEIFPEEIDQARAAKKLMQEKAVSGLSIGYSVVEEAIDRVKRVRNLLKVKLFETSVVTFPMNTLARVTTVKSEDIQTIRDFENALVDMGFSRGAAKGIASTGYKEPDVRDGPGLSENERDVLSDNLAEIKDLRDFMKR